MHWIEEGKIHLAKDPALKDLILKHTDIPLFAQKRVDLFSSLAHAITNQQLSGKVANIIFNRLRDLFPRRHLKPELLLKMKQDKLRAVGLSWNKIRSLRDLAEKMVTKKNSALHRAIKIDG